MGKGGEVMSSDTKGQLVIFTCDSCGDTFEAAGKWKEVWEAAKEDGWRAHAENNEWFHKCPECLGR